MTNAITNIIVADAGNQGKLNLVALSREIIADQARTTELGNDRSDPDYTKRDAIWARIDTGLAALIVTLATTLPDIAAKASVAVVIPSDNLTAAIFADILAMAA